MGRKRAKQQPNTYSVRHIAQSPSRMTRDLNATKLIHFYYTTLVGMGVVGKLVGWPAGWLRWSVGSLFIIFSFA